MIGWIVENTRSCGNRTYVSRLRQRHGHGIGNGVAAGVRRAVADAGEGVPAGGWG